MKNKVISASIILFTAVLGLGCGALNKNSKGSDFNEAIPAHSRMLIRVEDASAFKLDIENLSDDTLVLERKGLDNLLITKASIKAIIEREAAAALSNSSNRGINVKLRVYDHKSKVVHHIEAIRKDTTGTK